MRPFGTVAVRVLVVLLCAVGVSAQVAHLDSVSLRALGPGLGLGREVTPAFLTLLAADAFVSLVAAALALMLAFGRGMGRGARALGVAIASWSYLLAYQGVVRLLHPATEGIRQTLFDAHFPMVEALGLGGIVAFTAAFPSPLAASDPLRHDALPVGVRTLQAIRAWLLRPEGPWVAAAAVAALVLTTSRLGGRPLSEAGLSPAMDVARFAAIAIVVTNLRRSWLIAGAADRRRLLWVGVGLSILLGGIGVLIGGNVLLAVTDWSGPGFAWRPVILDAGFVGLLWGLAMSVFYRGAADSARVIRGVAALAASATLALLVATGLEVLLSGTLVPGASLPAGVGTALAVVFAAALHPPVRKLVDRALTRGHAPIGSRPAAL